MEVEELRQVDVAERVAGDDDERVVEPVGGESNRPGGSERALLDGVLDVQTHVRSVAEVRADRLRQERDGHDDVVHPVLAHELEDVLHARLADDRNHRLRLVRRQRTQARAFAACHHDGSHVSTTLRARATYSSAAATATAKPIQKITRGHASPLSVTITNASAA